MAMGLVGADVGAMTAVAVITMSTAAGALSIFGVTLGQNYAHRESQLATLEEEKRLLEQSPQEEIEELAGWFEAKGVSAQTSLEVAQEMSRENALAAQLELEYGIREVMSVHSVWMNAIFAGLAFVAGAMIPVMIAYLVPFSWRDEYTVVTAVLALTITSVILTWLGKSKFWPTVARTLTVGMATLAITYYLGDWLI